jgi:hypothetical protein
MQAPTSYWSMKMRAPVAPGYTNSAQILRDVIVRTHC